MYQIKTEKGRGLEKGICPLSLSYVSLITSFYFTANVQLIKIQPIAVQSRIAPRQKDSRNFCTELLQS